MLEQLCADAGFVPNVVHEVNDVTIARAFVAAGLGVAVLPELAVPQLRRRRTTVRDVQPFRSVYATWLRGRRVHVGRTHGSLSGRSRDSPAGLTPTLRRWANLWPHGHGRGDRGGRDRGCAKLVVEVEDQDRALRFWRDAVGFELVQDTHYRGELARGQNAGQEHDPRAGARQGDVPVGPEELPTSNIFFDCDDLPQTYEELRARGVEFPQPPVEQSFGWWSMFQDNEGNRFALQPREA